MAWPFINDCLGVFVIFIMVGAALAMLQLVIWWFDWRAKNR